MSVLISGAAGFFGRALLRAFANAGERVIAVDVLPEAEFEPRSDTAADQLTYVQASVADKDALTPDLLGNPSGIVHAAALTPSLEEMKAEPDKLVQVNLIGTLNMLEFARSNSVERFLFISSGGVYDQFSETTLREQDADGGFSLYGSAKLAAEIMLWRYAKIFGFDAGAVRPTSMYGPAEEFRSTRPFVTQIKDLAEAAARGEAIRVAGLDARCDWVYVDDVAEAAQRFFSAGMGGRAFNLSSGTPTRFADVVATAKDVLGLQVDEGASQVVDGSPDRPTVLSPEAATRDLGWQPRSLGEGLQSYADATVR